MHREVTVIKIFASVDKGAIEAVVSSVYAVEVHTALHGQGGTRAKKLRSISGSFGATSS